MHKNQESHLNLIHVLVLQSNIIHLMPITISTYQIKLILVLKSNIIHSIPITICIYQIHLK